jgi:hypothetical protein
MTGEHWFSIEPPCACAPATAAANRGSLNGRLRRLGVDFTQEPTQMGPVKTAVFDDTCGNLIQIADSS